MAATERHYLKPVSICITEKMIDNVGLAYSYIKATDDHHALMLLRDTLLDKTELMNEVMRLKKELEAANFKIWQTVQALIYNTLTKIKREPKWMMDNHLGNFDSSPKVQFKVGFDPDDGKAESLLGK
jgi:hypothetical protein